LLELEACGCFEIGDTSRAGLSCTHSGGKVRRRRRRRRRVVTKSLTRKDVRTGLRWSY